MKYVYGPVPSRRLGRSLGVSPIPAKTCNYSCIYCQLGRTTNYTNEREMFYPVEDIIEEVKKALAQDKKIDYITIVGEGEPTLYKGLGSLIDQIKKLSSLPLAVITNGALLYDEEVRQDLLHADVIMPTLDANTEELFRKINRPYKGITLNKIIDGFKKFREMYSNQIWLEVMLVKDINDDVKTVESLKEIIQQLKVDRIYINVPIRPPAESWVKIPSSTNLIIAQDILKAENIAHLEEILVESIDRDSTPENQILHIVKRHPLRDEQILRLFPDMDKTSLEEILSKMEKSNLIESVYYNKRKFWKAKLVKQN